MTLAGHETIARTLAVLADVRAERLRQEDLVAAGAFRWTCASRDPEITDSYRLAVMTEELGEVARHVVEETSGPALREELVQLAAVAVAWAESIPEPEPDPEPLIRRMERELGLPPGSVSWFPESGGAVPA